MNYLIAILVWPIALASIPAKDTLFGGQIYVWPFLLASCALAALGNWRAALVLAVGVAGSQIVERTMAAPEVYQLAFYATLAFIALWLFDIVAGTTAAVVAILYFIAAMNGLDWRVAMIVSEVCIIAGLSAAVLSGPTGGIYQRMAGTDRAGVEDVRAAVPAGRGLRAFNWRLLDRQEADGLGETLRK